MSTAPLPLTMGQRLELARLAARSTAETVQRTREHLLADGQGAAEAHLIKAAVALGQAVAEIDLALEKNAAETSAKFVEEL